MKVEAIMGREEGFKCEFVSDSLVYMWDKGL